jgi:hypothetical protein
MCQNATINVKIIYVQIKFGNNKIVKLISCLVTCITCQKYGRKYNKYGNDCYSSCNSTSIVPGKLSTDFAVKFFIDELSFDDTFSLHFFRLQILLNILLGILGRRKEKSLQHSSLDLTHKSELLSTRG